MMYALSSSSLKRLEGVDERWMPILRLALSLSPVDFGIPPYGGLRTEEEQALLFAQGKSKADGIVKKSKHQSGLAVDVYAYVNGSASWKEEHLLQVACAILQAAHHKGTPIDWGGLWRNFKDMPHFEIRSP